MRHHGGHRGHGRRHGFGMGGHGRRGFGFGGVFRRTFFGRRPFGGCLTLPFISIFILMAMFLVTR